MVFFDTRLRPIISQELRKMFFFKTDFLKNSTHLSGPKCIRVVVWPVIDTQRSTDYQAGAEIQKQTYQTHSRR